MRVPTVKLGLFVFCLVAARLSNLPFGFFDAFAQGILYCVAQEAHLARDLPVQAAHDGALVGIPEQRDR